MDMNAWFLSMKDTSSPDKLFSKSGTHWTLYGALLAGDTLIKYLSRERNIRLPTLEITKKNYSYTPRVPDADLADGLNLAIPLPAERLCYPEYTYHNDSTRQRPKMIFIGDSFVWPLITNGLLQNISKDWEFWYYFREVYRDGRNGMPDINNYDWMQSIKEADCIIFIYNPANLKSFSGQHSVVEAIYNGFFPAKQFSKPIAD